MQVLFSPLTVNFAGRRKTNRPRPPLCSNNAPADPLNVILGAAARRKLPRRHNPYSPDRSSRSSALSRIIQAAERIPSKGDRQIRLLQHLVQEFIDAKGSTDERGFRNGFDGLSGLTAQEVLGYGSTARDLKMVLALADITEPQRQTIRAKLETLFPARPPMGSK